jgi:hypothetical protein
MANIKNIMSLTLPITIILLIVGFLNDWAIRGVLVVLAAVQGIFWSFVKHH